MSSVPVLLLGESGSGKEVLARAIHAMSMRKGAFVPVNCGALPETLIEGQLFGHAKGAFSGAVRDEVGLVRASDGGTLFLDEIGDLPKTSQAALLRVLQEREVMPVGATRTVKVDLRVVAATHRRVQDTPEFRADLYARLAGFTFDIPPLRARREDLGMLIAALLAKLAPERTLRFSSAAGTALLRYSFPLNVRELHQALSVALVLATEDVIEVAHLPESIRKGPTSVTPPRQELTSEDEQLRASLTELLRAHQGNVSIVAREMNKTRMQIHRWMKRFAIDPEAFRR
jgi:DNA-binding NtrC family response regulator